MSGHQRSLKIFLCHSTVDTYKARRLYLQLIDEGADVWFAEESLLLGQKWENEIPKAISESDIVIVCLSSDSVKSEGYVHTEINLALSVADRMPEEKIFIIPIRLDDCELPSKLRKYQWANFFENKGYEKLLKTLRLHAEKINVLLAPKINEENSVSNNKPINQNKSTFRDRRLANYELEKRKKDDADS